MAEYQQQRNNGSYNTSTLNQPGDVQRETMDGTSKQSNIERVGAILIIPLTIAVTAISLKWNTSDTLGFGPIQYGSFSFHTTVMPIAFGLFLPLALSSYSVLEKIGGLGHGTAKVIHAFSHLCALVIGLVGIMSMWKTHGGSGSGNHFQTNHSMIGIMAFGLYCAMAVGSAFVFFIGSPQLRARTIQAHGVVGKWIAISLIIVMMLGIMKVETPSAGSKDPTVLTKQRYWRTQNFLFIFLILAIGLLSFRPPRKQKDNSLLSQQSY